MSRFRRVTGGVLASLLVLTTAFVGASPASAVDTTSPVVISEVYGGGGNSGASFSNDFIELYNRSTEPVSIDGLSVQYASASGTSWSNLTVLAGTIPASGFYLVAEAAGTTPSTALPAAGATGGINLSSATARR